MTEELPQDRNERRVEPLDVTRALAVLSNAQRRYLLYYLLEDTDGVADVDSLASYLWTVSFGEGAADDDIESRLHHQHLPKMEEVGIVEYDDGSSTVRYQDDKFVEDVLAVAAEYDRPEDA